MAKVSVIIPVYNAEEFLEKCIDSALKQTLTDIEIILVNDGSKDGSAFLCGKIAKNDHRVKVIHQENQGASAARNNALSVASGDYIGFIDSDDFIDPCMFEKMLNVALREGSDIVMCDALTVYSNGKTETDTILQLNGDINLQKKDLHLSLLVEMAGAVWRCIYRRELLLDHNIAFPRGIRFSEDRVFNILAFGFSKKISYMKQAFYYRYVNKDSIVHRFHADYFECFKKAKVKTDEALEFAWDNSDILILLFVLFVNKVN